MNNKTAKSIVMRALAFVSALTFSLAIVSGLPSVRERRQRYFAQATMDGSLRRMQLLRLAGANVNSRGDCCMPLFLAAGEGRLEGVRYLLDEGADINAREMYGNTALTEATYYGHVAVIKELLFRGADINAIGDHGTALDVAIAKKHEVIADLLEHHGAKRACEIRKCD